ncbi:hypothetical protein SEEH1831_11937 [Salmonella enterica subsp. enterica serovar Heidelberg str. 77-1831]|nr:hypothetical protein SEEH1831_11937 [Salmonella enterica subsp. enterica serovar Heidelberg str. 77-1831]
MWLVWVVCIATGAWNAFRFFCNRRQNAFNASSDGIREELLELFLLATERNYLLFRSTRGYVRIGTEQGLLKDTVCQKKILIHDEDKVLKVHSMECRIEKFLRMISFTV